MRVVLTRCTKLERRILDAVYDTLIAVPGPLEFEKASKSVAVGGDAISLDWDEIFAACTFARTRLDLRDEDFLVLLVDQRNNSNWFSSCNPKGGRDIFIHSAEWDTYVDAPSEHPIAFQVIENILQVLMFDTLADGVAFFHDPPIGCINDMCSWKPDITFKLRTADVCLDCQRVLRDRGVPEDLVKQAFNILEQQRQFMLFRTPVSEERANFGFPFPIAITRRKISGTTEPFRRFLMLLDHFDALVRCTVITAGSIAMGTGFAEFFREKGLSERPALGHWVEALRYLSKKREAAIPTLPAALLARIQKVVERADEAGIVSLRNERRGHGYCDCRDSTYQSLFIEHLPTVTDIEVLLQPFYARTIWRCTLSMAQPEAGTFTFSCKDLTGDHPDFIDSECNFRPTTVEELPRTGAVYAVVGGTRWYSLDPFVRYCACPACGHHRVLISDGEKYIDPYVGHRVVLGT